MSALHEALLDGFPRARGDGPVTRWGTPFCPTVPPRTRGWSPSARKAYGFASGSPAHAGMVPCPPSSTAWSGRFPRARGDGPQWLDSWFDDGTVPPRTRGWSLEARRQRRLADGSPAHAGMVPLSNSSGVLSMWFPRARGDGPRIRRFLCSLDKVPPRTRGWSFSAAASTSAAIGSPAHAGMVPTGSGLLSR